MPKSVAIRKYTKQMIMRWVFDYGVINPKDVSVIKRIIVSDH